VGLKGSILPSLHVRSIEKTVTRFFDQAAIACHRFSTFDEPLALMISTGQILYGGCMVRPALFIEVCGLSNAVQ
jgi:hypothetical protein